MAAKRLDLSRTWADVVAMARANADMLSAVAGMFILLPQILSAWVLPDPERPERGAPRQDIVNANLEFVAAHWPVLLASALVVAFGSLALLALLLRRERPTVAGALRIGIAALPAYMLANMLQGLAVMAGLMLFIVPGLYLAARFLCIAAVAVNEDSRSPMAILVRAFRLTDGNGLRILLLIGVIVVVAIILSVVLNTVVGSIALLLLPLDIARFVRIVTGSLVETSLAVTLTLVGAAVYRQTSGAAGN